MAEQGTNSAAGRPLPDLDSAPSDSATATQQVLYTYILCTMAVLWGYWYWHGHRYDAGTCNDTHIIYYCMYIVVYIIIIVAH